MNGTIATNALMFIKKNMVLAEIFSRDFWIQNKWNVDKGKECNFISAPTVLNESNILPKLIS